MKKYSLKQMRKRDNYNESDNVFVGQEIYEFKEVSSTMNVIKQVSSNSGTVVVSETQTQGKGRFERESCWILLNRLSFRIQRSFIHSRIASCPLRLLITSRVGTPFTPI